MENLEEMQVEQRNDKKNMEESKLKCDMIWKTWQKIVKRYEKYGRKASWIVKTYEKYVRNPSWIVKSFGKYGRKMS